MSPRTTSTLSRWVGHARRAELQVEWTQIRVEAAWQIHYTQAGGITGHV